MPLKIYSTIGQRKGPFDPLVPGEVRMYACGPTVYDLAHIGHARAAMTFDVIWRYLEFRGYKVTYVRNYTDVDDKIINRASELGQAWDSLAEEQIEGYRQDMHALGLRTPTVEPRATRHIGEMIAIIQALVNKGVAYAVEGDVYFEVRRCADYGKLSHRDLEELRAGARVEVDERKRDPLDFALWKASKPGEPAWSSPWGRGRPGWHIECSAMSMKYLGETFDIHGGGADLVFPHHENEIAQSESATGKPFARYWIHNGFVNIHAEKMSKSLGNVLTVRDLLNHVTPGALKIFLLGTHYRAPLDLSHDAITSAGRAEDRLLTALSEIRRFQEAEPPNDPSSQSDHPLLRQIRHAEREFTDAMDDDFNTPRALAAIFNLVRDINVALKDAERAPGKVILDALRLADETLRRLGSVLSGLLEDSLEVRVFSDVQVATGVQIEISEHSYHEAREAVDRALTSGGPVPEDQVRVIVEYRRQRREEKEWAVSDDIRAWLTDRGVIVDDTAKGARWHFKSSRA
ncbi:MAG: cysteine--tRNA ligase [Candidatus Methylomirabilis sp.]